MTRSWIAWSLVPALAAVLSVVPAAADGQSPPPQSPASQPATPSPPDSSSTPALPPISPAQVERIQRALNQPQGVKFDDQQLRFYIEIVAKRPTFAEFAKGYDFINGPTKSGNPMSHQEFVQMVTPKDMYSTAGITPFEQLQGAFTNWIGQSLIRKALDELKQAKTEREVQEIRERIDRELAALTGARGR